MTNFSILDLSLAGIREVQIPAADAPALIAVEQAWKKRKVVLAYLKRLVPPAEVQIECIAANVHLGDGRQLGRGERAWVKREVAELIVERGLAVHVG